MVKHNQEAEAGELWVQEQPGLHSKFQGTAWAIKWDNASKNQNQKIKIKTKKNQSTNKQKHIYIYIYKMECKEIRNAYLMFPKWQKSNLSYGSVQLNSEFKRTNDVKENQTIKLYSDIKN
jgi:hypothetical protein